MTTDNPAGQIVDDNLPSRVVTRIDFDANGKHHDVLRVPHSRDDSAWGFVQIPITVIRNGVGPTILLTGAAHGDEYEGPISLLKLAQSIDPATVRGRVVMIPALNIPAVQSATRVSPIDGVNLNRTYPGRRTGSVSQMIADFVYRRLVDMADIVVDFHSGGKTLDFVPSAVMHQLDDPTIFRQTVEAVRAFGAPIGLILKELDAEGMLDTAVEALGKPFISTELGGGGRVTARTMAISDRGLTNLLHHFNLLDPAADPLRVGAQPATETRLMHTPVGDCFIVSDHAGLFEMLVDPGSVVRYGEPVGRIHFFENPGTPAVTYYARAEGILLARHFPGLIKKGDCMAVIASDFDPVDLQ